jgi:3-methyladenine DNA glycosylase/8-oxoguanine DNA glycosylase
MGTRGFDSAAALEHLLASDPVLGRTIDQIGPFTFTLQKTPSTFGALAEAIVYQQLNGRAAATIFGRVRALIPGNVDYLEAEHLIDVSDEALRGAGLSRSKLLSIRDLAERTRDGTVPTLARAARMDDEALIEHLIEVRGIGRWTAQMFLMFRLGRPDVLPADDYGLRKGFAEAFKKKELPDKDELLKRGERWAPYRSVASWYLWRMADMPFNPRTSSKSVAKK